MVAVPSIGRASLLEPCATVAPEATVTHGLYEQYAGRIYAYCLHRLGSREEAEDAVQTTFMNAFRALGKGIVPETEAAWLFKIAENVCLSRRRSSWRRNRVESPADFDVIEELVPGANRQRDELIGIEDALAALPEQQRRAILLREWQGLSYREISGELQLSQSAVETLIFRARRSLARGLTQPASVKPGPELRRKRLRSALHLVDLTTLLGAAKSLLTGAAALKAATAAVVVTAAAGTAVTVSSDRLDPPPKPPLAVAAAPPVAVVAPVALAAPVASAASAPTLAPPAPVAAAPAAPEAKVVRGEKAEKNEHNEKPVSRPTRRRARSIAPLPVEPERSSRLERKAEKRDSRAERRTERQADKAERRAQREQRRAERRSAREARKAPVAETQSTSAERGTKKRRRDERRGAAAPASEPPALDSGIEEPAPEATDDGGDKRAAKHGRRRR